ncbi:hypothetical protein SAMN06269250_5960 [Spirosoma fluviale]|uniref:Uncharacterized protein n=1 Tax=Spirosoma fluviale TaxID=1597977 RepID=A0A286GQX7_9BACT|nr:hypothetical protein SAMN06269250_5960 [Spirosoma fluviale]
MVLIIEELQQATTPFIKKLVMSYFFAVGELAAVCISFT